MLNFFKHILIPLFVCMIVPRLLHATSFQPQNNYGVSSRTNSTRFVAPKISQIGQCLKLLEQGERKIVLSERRYLNLVLGLTGTGKSTFTAWFAGDDSKLWAKRTGHSYIIEDEDDKIGDSSFESKTVWPELQIDFNDNSTVFYDCPGFDEARDSAHDISQAYFIKRIVDHAEKVKIILIVSHISVIINKSRKDFADMLEHITALIPDIEKFRESIAMVVTKVDNRYKSIRNIRTLISDEEIIEHIGNFVFEAKKFYVNSRNLSGSEILNKKIQLLDILLTKNRNKYSRIGIFRRPSQLGRLSEDELLVNGKKHVKVIIKNTLNYTPKKDEDFRYSISATSKNDVGEWVEEINKHIWTKANKMVQEVKEQLKHSLNKSLDFNSESEIVERMLTLEDVIASLRIVGQVEEILQYGKVEVTSNGHIINLMKNVTDAMNNKLSQDFLFNLENQEKHFKFLETASEKPLSSIHAQLTAKLKTITETSSSSKQAIIKDAGHVQEKVLTQLKEKIPRVTNDIREIFLVNFKDLQIEELLNQHVQCAEFTKNAYQEMGNSNDFDSLLETATELFQNLNIAGMQQKLNEEISLRMRFIVLLQIVSDQDAYPQVQKLVLNETSSLKQHFVDFSKFYAFLIDLYNKLSEHKFQSRRTDFNVANVDDWGKPGKSRGIQINEQNFKQFLNQLKQYKLQQQDFVEKLSPTPEILQEINEVLSKTLKVEIEIVCSSPGTMIVKGTFVIFSDILDLYFNKSCGEINGMKSIEIFALSSFFIDRDFYAAGRKLKLVFVSPKLQVIGSVGSKTVTLDGKPSLDIVPATERYGATRGIDGKDGKSADSGGPSGAFYGIFETRLNEENLKILANGGRGGNGQNGGYGKDAVRGPDGWVINYEGEYQNCEHLVADGKFKLDWFRMLSTSVRYFTSRRFYRFGYEGGVYGCYGFGGLGGMPGKIEFSFSDHKISVENVKGPNGRNGISHEVTCRSRIQYAQDITEQDLLSMYDTQEYIQKNDQNNIKKEKNCAFERPSEEIVPAAEITNKASIIISYKSFLIENLHNRFNRKILTHFKKHLDETKSVNYRTLDFVEELQMLESKNLKSQFLLPFYESLLRRLDNYGDSMNGSSIPDDHKKVLKHVYAATQNTIFQLRHNYDTNFVININSYLDVVSKNIENLNGLNADKRVLEVVNNYKKEYAAGFDEKIDEAQNLIDSEITPAIDKIQKDMDREVLNLLDEIEKIKQSTEQDKDKLLKLRDDARKKLRLRALLAPLKVVGTVVSFLGPKGKAAGAVISGGVSVAEKIFLDPTKSNADFATVSASVKKNQDFIFTNFKNFHDNRSKQFMKILDDISKEVLESSDSDLGNMAAKLEEIRKKHDEAKNDIYFNWDELENKFQEGIKEEISLLKKKNLKESGTLEVLERCSQIIQLASVGSDIYSSIKNDVGKIGEISDLIDSADLTLKALATKTQDVHNILYPMLKVIQKDTEKQIKDLENKSLVVLDVGKWQIQKNLKNTLKALTSFTKGFEVEEEFKSLIDDLEQAMLTTINIFDRIQNYQDQQALGNYIADINSAHIQGITITDVALNAACHDLEISIRSRIILQQYSLAIAAFKHWVFPLAEIYLVEFKPPTSSGFETSSTNILVSDVWNQITRIRAKVKEYNSLITKNEAYIMNGEFNSELVSSKPFCVWKNVSSRAMIKKILSGEEVFVNSNINLYDKDAIKFNFAEFHFKAVNQSLQTELVQTLKAFKISTTHMGNSRYRFNGNFYAISSTKLEIVYSFEKRRNGEPAFKNDIYVKLKDGDIMLSPYTNWKVKITKATENIPFDVLEKFIDKVDLEIIGVGKYIKPHKIKVDVDSFYKTISGFH